MESKIQNRSSGRSHLLSQRESKKKNLRGKSVELELLSERHLAGITEALMVMPQEVWSYLPNALSTRPAIEMWFDNHLSQARTGERIPYAIIDSSGDIVGSTCYLDISLTNRRREIGWTWLIPRVWGNGINTECKFLLLEHAFEDLDCVKVQFKTDANNARSRAALEKIGATHEGTLRKHMILSTGKWRDSAYYGITSDDWAAVRDTLQELLERP